MSGIDAAIVVAYLLVMVGVGVWFMRRNRSSDDYFRGGGRLPWWVVSLSIYATLFSSITFLSVPALTYHGDCRYFLKTVGILVLVPIVIRFYLPFFRKLNLTSAYEYLEVRFNLGCRLFASAAFVLFMIARTAVVAYLPSVAIAAVTGIDVNLAIVLVTLITVVYCTIGGVEAVVWSDFVQSVILIGSTIAIYAYLVCGTDGGLSGFLAKGTEAGKFRMMDLGWDWSQPVLWVALVGGLVENLASYTSDQCVVQRYMTCRDEAGAAKSIRLNGVLSFVNCFVFFTLGVALWTFYQSHADKIPTLAKNDQIFPWFIAHELPAGFAGLVLAAVAAATMSTLSANLNSAATAVTTDFYKRLTRSGTDRRLLLCGKVTTVVVGLLGGAVALVLANVDIGSVYDPFLKALGVLTGGLACLFLMGRFMPFVNGRAAFAGLVANYAVCFSLDFLPSGCRPHLLLYGFLGMVACLAVATAVALAGARKSAAVTLAVLLSAGVAVAREPNYDKSRIAPYALEDPLTFADGRKVATPTDWELRRKEILGVFAREMYGAEPPAPESLVTELWNEKDGAAAGFAVRRQYRMWFRADKTGPCVNWIVWLPRHAKRPAPVILFLNYRGNHELVPDADIPVTSAWLMNWSGRYGISDGKAKEAYRGIMQDPDHDTVFPLGMLLARGYAVMSACYAEVSPDKADDAWHGVFDLWGRRDPARTDDVTALGAWAWALSRGLDLAVRIPEIDARRSVVTGYSRLGKAAFVAAARDTRFAVCVPVQTGGGGAPLAKRDYGENVSTETRRFPHWYCRAYAKYADAPEKTLPFDQHLFAACIAPRALLVTGFDEPWFDTEGEYLALRAASPAWEFLCGEGLPGTRWPDDFETSAIGRRLGYVRRSEKHGIAAADWQWLLDFAGPVLESMGK